MKLIFYMNVNNILRSYVIEINFEAVHIANLWKSIFASLSYYVKYMIMVYNFTFWRFCSVDSWT